MSCPGVWGQGLPSVFGAAVLGFGVRADLGSEDALRFGSGLDIGVWVLGLPLGFEVRADLGLGFTLVLWGQG